MAAPLQIAEMTHFPRGASSFGMPIIGDDDPTTGQVLFVDSTSPNKGDDASHGKTPQAPFATWNYAIGQCVANRGDRIYILPGHTENIIAAAGVNLRVAGVSTRGMGHGRDRPIFTFTTSTGASVRVTAASCSVFNLVFDCTGVDALVAAIDVQAADFLLHHCEFTFATAAGQALGVILTDANSDRAQIIGNTFSGSDDAGNVTVIRISDGGDDIVIANNHIRGSFSLAAIYVTSAPSGQPLNLTIENNFIVTKLTGIGPDQVCIQIADVSATGQLVKNICVGTNLAQLIINGGLMATVQNFGYDGDTIQTNGTEIPPIGTQLGVNQSLIDQIIGAGFSFNRANLVSVTANFALAAWNTIAQHEVFTVTGAVRARIIPLCVTDLTSGGAANIQFGLEGTTNAFIAATLATDIDANEFWLTATPAKQFAFSSVIDRIIAGGLDIGYEITAFALTGGSITFLCIWEPLTFDGNVVAGTGAAL